MPHMTPPLDRPLASTHATANDGLSMTLQQALAARAARCACRRMEPDHQHPHARVIMVQHTPPREWWVYEYGLADGVITGWQMRDEQDAESYLDAQLHTPRNHGWWPASGLLDVQALRGVSLPE